MSSSVTGACVVPQARPIAIRVLPNRPYGFKRVAELAVFSIWLHRIWNNNKALGLRAPLKGALSVWLSALRVVL